MLDFYDAFSIAAFVLSFATFCAALAMAIAEIKRYRDKDKEKK